MYMNCINCFADDARFPVTIALIHIHKRTYGSFIYSSLHKKVNFPASWDRVRPREISSAHIQPLRNIIWRTGIWESRQHEQIYCIPFPLPPCDGGRWIGPMPLTRREANRPKKSASRETPVCGWIQLWPRPSWPCPLHLLLEPQWSIPIHS